MWKPITFHEGVENGRNRQKDWIFCVNLFVFEDFCVIFWISIFGLVYFALFKAFSGMHTGNGGKQQKPIMPFVLSASCWLCFHLYSAVLTECNSFVGISHYRNLGSRKLRNIGILSKSKIFLVFSTFLFFLQNSPMNNKEVWKLWRWYFAKFHCFSSFSAVSGQSNSHFLNFMCSIDASKSLMRIIILYKI